jgi:glucokinase
MALLGIDLGGTKLALAVVSADGRILSGDTLHIGSRKGSEVGDLIRERTAEIINSFRDERESILSIGISVPGISHVSKGTVWAPNIQGWEDYPLLEEMLSVAGDIPVTIDSDRACYILGEAWQGSARGCRDAIFLSVGTGIGAGIMINGEILRGSNDIAGCIGWMALQKPFRQQYKDCGCFEYHASGEGIGKVATELLHSRPDYEGKLRDLKDPVRASDVFDSYRYGDPVAVEIIKECISFWGMAVANLVSLFNPEKIIFGGGVFGPGADLLDAIGEEAARWAQPVGMGQVTMSVSTLGGDAGVIGAAYLALRKLTENT